VKRFEQAARERFPHLIQELEGMAEGCGIAYADLFAWNCRSEIGAASAPCAPGCSTIGLVRGPTMILAHNEDGNEAYAGRMVVVRVRPPSGIGFTVLLYPGTLPGNGPGINQRGVAQTTNYIAPCDAVAGIPRYFIGRAVLEASSLAHAIELATTPGRAFPWHHNLASCGDGRLVSLETWPGRHHKRDVAGLHLHTNHLVHPEMQGLAEKKKYLARSSLPRLRSLQRLAAGRQLRERDDLLALLQDRTGSPCKLCRRPGDEVPGVTVATASFAAPRSSMVLRNGPSCNGPENRYEP